MTTGLRISNVTLIREHDFGAAEVYIEFDWHAPASGGASGETGIHKLKAGESSDFDQQIIYPPIPLNGDYLFWTVRAVERDPQFSGNLIENLSADLGFRGLVAKTAGAGLVPLLGPASKLLRAGLELWSRPDELCRGSGYMWPEMEAQEISITGPEKGPSADITLEVYRP